jgi:hypothetical protein
MSSDPRNEVVVVNINMPFWSMVRFMVKWAIAAIPAIIILAIIGTIISAVFAAVLGHSAGGKWL